MDDVLSWFERDNVSFDKEVANRLFWVTLIFVYGEIDPSLQCT